MLKPPQCLIGNKTNQSFASLIRLKLIYSSTLKPIKRNVIESINDELIRRKLPERNDTVRQHQDMIKCVVKSLLAVFLISHPQSLSLSLLFQ